MTIRNIEIPFGDAPFVNKLAFVVASLGAIWVLFWEALVFLFTGTYTKTPYGKNRHLEQLHGLNGTWASIQDLALVVLVISVAYYVLIWSQVDTD